MLEVRYSKQFKKDFKLMQKQGRDLSELKKVIDCLAEEKLLAKEYKDHPLTGKWKAFRECHIQPDWLLVYHIDEGELVLTAQRTGTHSELFK